MKLINKIKALDEKFELIKTKLKEVYMNNYNNLPCISSAETKNMGDCVWSKFEYNHNLLNTELREKLMEKVNKQHNKLKADLDKNLNMEHAKYKVKMELLLNEYLNE